MAKAKSSSKALILERTERERVKFTRLQFTDILGTVKNVEIPDRQFEEAVDGKITDALDELEKDDLKRDTLGDHLFEQFVTAKCEEWLDYIKHVSPWEVDRYLEMY